MMSWEEINRRLIEVESYGTYRAQKALEIILGDEWIEHAVNEVFLSNGHSSELALNCLQHISSLNAAKIAYAIFKYDSNDERKYKAVWLIQQLRVRESFEWVEEFLCNKDLMFLGIGLLDQLLWWNIIDYNEEKEKIDFLFNIALKKANMELNERMKFIKEYLMERGIQHIN